MNKFSFFLKARAGFTILEMLVVVSIMTMLTGVLIVYSRTSENQIILFKEHAKLVSVFFRAKTLAYQTFSEQEQDPKPCAYGVHYSSDDSGDAFYVFRDLPDTAGDCTTANQQFDADEVFETVVLDPRVIVDTSETTFTEVLFTPPDPTTLINQSAAAQGAQVVVRAEAGSGVLGVKINDAGQITAFRPDTE